MERWRTRARRWEFRAAQRRLERKQKAKNTISTIRDEETVLPPGNEPESEMSNDNRKIAA